MREDRRGLEQLAGGRDYRDLHAGTQAGIQADHRLLARGRTEQQVLEIRAEHPDRLGVGGLAQAGEQFALEVDLQLHAPAPAQHVGEPAIGGRSVVGERPAELEQAREPCDTRMRLLRLAFSAEGQAQGQHALVPTAEQRERTVRRHGGNRLGMIEVVAELLGDLGGRSVLALHPLGCDRGLVPQEVAERCQHIGPLGEPLDEDVARAVERGLDVGDTPFGRHVGERGFLRIQAAVGQQGLGERAETGLARDLRLAATLGLVGQVEVLDLLLRDGRIDR